jgi:short-subunit dehydrogenase
LPLKDPKRFAQQVILITGASSGIGLAAAEAFAKEGASLMLAARRLDRLNQAAAACRAFGVPCEFFGADVQDHQQVLRLVDQTIEKFGRIDVLVNNAGLGFFGPFHAQPWENITRTLRTNFEAALALCHAVIPYMIKQGSGTILNVSSVVGKRAVQMLAAYSATKFGLWGFSQSLRLELRPHGIQVCHFCPTSTATEFQQVAGIEPSRSSPPGLHSADQVASAMVEAVIKRKPEHIMSLTERLLIKCHLVAPALTDRLLDMVRRNRGAVARPTKDSD